MGRPKKNGSKSGGGDRDVETSRRLARIISSLSFRLEKHAGVDARREFILQARQYARQSGFDGVAVSKSFMVYILVGSKRSVLRSVRKTNYPKKKDVEKVIVRAAQLIPQYESLPYELQGVATKLYSEASATSVAAARAHNYHAADEAQVALFAAKTVIYVASNNYHAADDSAAHAFAIATSTAIRGTAGYSFVRNWAFIDYAAGLLKIMKKEAERAKRKSNPKKKATKKRSKRSKKKATKKNPTGNLRIGSVVNGWWVERISKYEGIPQTIALYTDLHGARHYLTIDYNITSGAQPKATSLEASLRRANEGFLGSKEFKSDSPSSDINKATKWAVTESFFTKKNPPKKKATKKKATRKKTPPWQLLINRCRKLWDHYCERPSKKRLKPVLEHLEKMKASTSKKVADERKSCLRIANKEARSLKMK